MSLKCGIVGLPNVGKSTLFNALTKAGIAAENYPFCTIEPNVGIVEVPDARLDALSAIVKPPAQGSAPSQGQLSEAYRPGSTLQAFCHLAAIFLQLRRHMIRADATLPVTGYGVVNELRVGQIEACHDGPELLQRAPLTEPRVALFFLGNGGNAPVLVVMGGINQRFVGQ